MMIGRTNLVIGRTNLQYLLGRPALVIGKAEPVIGKTGLVSGENENLLVEKAKFLSGGKKNGTFFGRKITFSYKKRTLVEET